MLAVLVITETVRARAGSVITHPGSEVAVFAAMQAACLLPVSATA